MRDMDAVLRTQPLLPTKRTIPMRPRRDASPAKEVRVAPSGVTYDQFKEVAWLASQQIEPREIVRPGVVSIPWLRRALLPLPAPTFNQHLLRLERNGLVYLIPPDDVRALSDEDRRECLPYPNGDLRSFVLWMSPKSRTLSFWD
jgi:hypothetical protein